jgi:hypothetical protein
MTDGEGVELGQQRSEVAVLTVVEPEYPWMADGCGIDLSAMAGRLPSVENDPGIQDWIGQSMERIEGRWVAITPMDLWVGHPDVPYVTTFVELSAEEMRVLRTKITDAGAEPPAGMLAAKQAARVIPPSPESASPPKPPEHRPQEERRHRGGPDQPPARRSR